MKAIIAIQQNIVAAFVRFPVAFLASAGFFLLSLFRGRNETELAILACTCFWAISATLFVESRNGKKWHGILAGIGGAIAFWLIFIPLSEVDIFFFPSPVAGWAVISLVMACVLSMKVAPYLRRNANAEAMAFFCSSLMHNITFTFWVTLLLFVGGAVILGSLQYLFGIRIIADIYFKFWLFCATFFAPVFAMGELPRNFDQTNEVYSKRQRIMLVNMLLPLMLVYTLILWLYILKILVLMELPKGHVAYLVSGFSLGSLVLYFFSSMQAASHYPVMMFWRRFFPLILSAPLVLLIIGITIRIRAYGVTEDRYAVALLAAWLTGVVLWTGFRRHNPQRLVWIYASGVLLMFLASFGPWSAASLSQWSQISRLETMLRDSGVLNAEGHIVSTVPDVPKHTVAEISSILTYLERSKKIVAIRPWFANQPDAHINKKLRHFSAANIMKDMGLHYTYSYHYRKDADTPKKKNIPISHAFDPLFSAPLDIRGYDRLVRTNFSKTATTKELGEGLTATFDNTQMRIILTHADKEPVAFPLDDIIALLKTNNFQPDALAKVPVRVDTTAFSGKLYVTNINGYFDEDNMIHINHLHIILLYQRR